MRYITAQEGVVIPLGRQGENEVTTIKFDVSGWAEEYGDGTFTLVHQRCNDGDGYERNITVADEVISWVITNVDVAYAGRGVVQLTYTVGDAVAKSVFYYTKVLPSLAASEDVPDVYEPWIETLDGYCEEAEAWAVGQRGGVDVGSSDGTYHNNSKWYAQQSSASAQESYDSADLSRQYMLQASGFVGAPLTATLKSQMTDTGRVYVYVGSESGMTSGHWYYHNGTAWVDGGVYNSIADDIATTTDIDNLLYS